MIRVYNGNVNRTILRDLKKICVVSDENKKILLEEFTKNGEASFYSNPCPITDCPDELSQIQTLRSETEIEEYIKKDTQQRLEAYLSDINPANDYLLNDLVEFIKKNGKSPNKDEMKQLEQAAEAKRIAELPSNIEIVQKPITEQDVMKEVLELSEEIIETRRETKPKDIHIHLEPYDDELVLISEDFHAVVTWDRHDRRGNSSDYRFKAILTRNNVGVYKILLSYDYNGVAFARAENWREEAAKEEDVKNCLVIIHKGIVEIAKQEGIEFISEIDYQKIIASEDNKDQIKILKSNNHNKKN